MRKILMAAASVAALAAPAAAQPDPAAEAPGRSAEAREAREERVLPPQAQAVDPRDEAIVRAMPHPAEVEAVGDAAARAVDAILDTPVGPLREAIEGRRLSRRERHETLGDRASRSDPYLRERMRDQIAVAGVAVGALWQQMAVMAPVLRRTLEDVERRMADAVRGVPPRDYDRDYERDYEPRDEYAPYPDPRD